MPKRKNTASEGHPKKHKANPEPETIEKAVTITKPNHKQAQKPTISWPESDIVTLLTRIEENIPEDDHVSYSTRLESLDWEKIKFKSHSGSECKEIWGTLSKQVRKFRLLGEIVSDLKEWVSKPKSHSPNHPAKPKQPFNSYMFFITEKRQEVAEQNPDLSPVEVARKLGQLYKELPDEEKEKYMEKAKTAKQEYLGKMQSFYEKHPEMIPKESGKKKKKIEVLLEPGKGPPEKPKTPFELFFKVESEKDNTDCSKFALTQKYRERWNNLTDTEKYFWIKWAEEQYEKYLQDLKEYIKEHPKYEPEKIKPIITKKEKKIKDRCSGKPTKPPNSAYQLCCKMILGRKEVKSLNKRELMNYIAEKWKSMPEEEKDGYRARVDEMWNEYETKFEEYLQTLPPEERNKVREQEGRSKRRSKSNSKTTPKKPKGTEKKNDKLEKPQKPPATVYEYFVSVHKGNENPTEIWNTLTKKEKEVFEEKLKEEQNNYIRLFEQYLNSLSKEELQKLESALADESSSESAKESEEEESKESEKDEEEEDDESDDD